MTKRIALALLLGLAGCHRGNVADVTLDADRAAENATAAKTIADLAEADKAASAPMPPRIERATPAAPRDSASSQAMPDSDEAPSDANEADAAHP